MKKSYILILVASLVVFQYSSNALVSGWKPTPRTTWQIQLDGKIDTTIVADVYDIDLFDSSQDIIDSLHIKGKKVICYFSAGSYEKWRNDSSTFPKASLGNKMSGWDELWLDVRNQDLRKVMEKRMDLAALKKCDAVDPDNIDGCTNSTGFPLTSQDQITYNKFLAKAAHNRGLAIGLKNDVDQLSSLVSDYDFAVNEECYTYNECSGYKTFIQLNKPVFGIQYKGVFDEKGLKGYCADSKKNGYSFIKKSLNLGLKIQSCPVK